ncbi:MAG: hypothetical protein EXR75_01885 [Myxococcales bacterium]|nr:hypothetical protein [Myxococcales bacterium]
MSVRLVAMAWAFTLAVTTLFVTIAARAQATVELNARVSDDEVEVGQSFTVRLSAMSETTLRYSEPVLRAPAGLSVGAPSLRPQTLVSVGSNGSAFRRGVTVHWQLTAESVGTFNIAAPTIVIAGKRFAAEAALAVRVVPRGQGGSGSQSRGPFSAFGAGFPFGPGGPLAGVPGAVPSSDPMADLMQQLAKRRTNELILDEPLDDLEVLSATGKRLALARGDDEHIFLRIVPDKSVVVVGEQVSLRYHAYYRVLNEQVDQREPKLTEFARVPLEEEPSESQRITTSVGARMWFVQEVNRIAVFPLRAGKFSTGRLTGKFRVPLLKNRVVERASNDVALDVREPPIEGRPVGYRVGDVGRFELRAAVEPRETIAGESVSVRVRLEGRGQLPNELRLPERVGLEWATPAKEDETDVVEGRVGGHRVFSYAVRIEEPGEVELGVVELPHYDPVKREYRVARTKLGSVRVRPNPARAANAKGHDDALRKTEDPFATLPKPRLVAQRFEPLGRATMAAQTFWTWLTVPPLGVGLMLLGERALSTWRRRRTAKKSDPVALARGALGAIGGAVRAGEATALGERALLFAIEAATGTKARGVLFDALEQTLLGRGLDGELAREATAILQAAAQLRFDPAMGDEDAQGFLKRVRDCCKELLRHEVSDA